ncbi:UNVERIFIED_CONTAM: hypothetical protein RMT77_006481 [Armadillidium vulgare]|nr:Charged multivesicular body protein 6 [Armadillidium vulgare]
MGHLFSKKKQSKVTQQDKALLELKTTRDKIRQYQKRSESTLQRDRDLAKQLLQNDKKERAKLLLRRKRFIEEKLKQADGQLENIEQLIQDIEFAQVEMKVVDSLKVGNDALKEINALMNIEDIEKILEETQEAVEKQKEIDALLSGGFLTDAEEEEVEVELEALLQDTLEKQLPEAPTAAENPEVVLPDVPEQEIVSAEKEKEKEREPVALEAS